MINFFKIKYISYLLLIFPFALVSGPFLPDLILSLSSIYFIFYLYLKKKIDFLFNDFSKIFILFYLYIVFRSLFTEEILFSLKNTLFYFRFWIFAYFLKYLFEYQKDFIKLFISCLFFTLLIISIDALIEYFRGEHWLFNKSSYPENDNHRISGLFDEEYILGGFVLALFPSTLMIYFKKIKNVKNSNYLILLTSAIFIFTIVITGERSSFVKLFLFLGGLILLTSLIEKIKFRILTIVILISIVFTAIIFQPKLNERLFYHTFDLLFQNYDKDKIDRNLSITEYIKKVEPDKLNLTFFSREHKDHAIISIKMFNDKKIFGHGVKMFRFKCSEKKYYLNPRACSTHPHGIILVFLSEIGLIGLMFLLVVYFYLTKNFFKSKSIFDKTILLSIFIYLFPLLPSGYFFNNYYSIILYTLLGVYLGTKKVYKLGK